MKVVAAITASIAAHAILFALAALLVAAGGEEVLPPSMEVSRVDLCLSGSEEDSAARSSSFFEPASRSVREAAGADVRKAGSVG